jgi:hypothetical protein
VKKDDPDLEFILADDFAGSQKTSPIVLVIRGLLLLAAATFVIAALIRVFSPGL